MNPLQNRTLVGLIQVPSATTTLALNPPFSLGSFRFVREVGVTSEVIGKSIGGWMVNYSVMILFCLWGLLTGRFCFASCCRATLMQGKHHDQALCASWRGELILQVHGMSVAAGYMVSTTLLLQVFINGFPGSRLTARTIFT